MKANRKENRSASQLSIHSAPPALEFPRLALYKNAVQKLGCKPPKIRYTAYFAKPVQVTQWRPNASTTLLPEAKQRFRVITLLPSGFIHVCK
jgi:hypothetical protein